MKMKSETENEATSRSPGASWPQQLLRPRLDDSRSLESDSACGEEPPAQMPSDAPGALKTSPHVSSSRWAESGLRLAPKRLPRSTFLTVPEFVIRP